MQVCKISHFRGIVADVERFIIATQNRYYVAEAVDFGGPKPATLCYDDRAHTLEVVDTGLETPAHPVTLHGQPITGDDIILHEISSAKYLQLLNATPCWEEMDYYDE